MESQLPTMQAAALVYKVTCAQSGRSDLGQLKDDLAGRIQKDELEQILGNKQLFVVCSLDGKKTVIAKTQLRLCRARDCSGCSNLHLCKLYLLSEDCPHNRGRRVCCFSHDLYSDHNNQLLRQHYLQELSREELCTLLLQSTLLPPVCFTYNRGAGEFGFCPDKDTCRRLHICEKYLRGTCYRGDCDRSHDFFEPHPNRILQARGVSSGMVGSLLSVYRNILAIWDSNSPGIHSRGTEICLFHIKNYCKQGNRCAKVHFHLPYRWEFKDGQGWSQLTDNETIEQDYCDPSKSYSGGNVPVHFDTMTRNSVEVRRLSTVSSVTQPTFILTTRWAWYWEDEFGHWTQYASSEGADHSASITSEELEKKYQEDNSAAIEFNAGKHTYELSMQDMIQSNQRFGTKRLVRRRPVFVSAAEVRKIKSSSVQTRKSMPHHWDKLNMPETGFKRVTLESSSKDYTAIADLFRQTMTGFRVTSIERVQNHGLWEVFQWQADQMRKNNSGRTNEKILFHGTDSKHVDAICQQNFDWRICGTHGTAYGKGSYFARDASYSHRYTSWEGTRAMFVCRVLVGEPAQGNPSLLRPPAKNGEDTRLYDSCVDDVCNPSIFVIFEKHQVYPEYLLQYEEGPETEAAGSATVSRPGRPRTKSLSSSSSLLLSPLSQPTIVTSHVHRRQHSMERGPSSNLTRSRGFGSLTSLNNLHQINSSSVFSVPRSQPRMTLYQSPARLRPFVTNTPRLRYTQPMTRRTTSMAALDQPWLF
ncbi:protein mono-ADP-ribosyltransferase PARP12-like isoform X2 [Sardina pilchardus]|uniref:protein mono-ADP-ribosyltransferase PARP12-like isoform X2 n=1 Tax=Sardina pilchardus TaxID=27697 RepID=UPI002E119D8F